MVRKNKIKIKLNGKPIVVDKGIKLNNLIKKFKYPLNKIAIEKNNLIVEKKKINKERRCIQINYVTFETDWKVK